MAQFDVHVLQDGTAVVNVQSDLLFGYRTTVVIPLVPALDLPRERSRLHPLFWIDDERLALAPQLLTAVPSRALGPVRASLVEQEYEIKAAIDMLISGY